MSVIRDARGRILPGQQALNPGGRPAIPPDLREELAEIFRAAAPLAARKLVELLGDPDTRVAAMAASHLLDRAVGKPVQAVDKTVTRLDIGQMHLAALQDIQSRRDARLANGSIKMIDG